MPILILFRAHFLRKRCAKLHRSEQNALWFRPGVAMNIVVKEDPALSIDRQLVIWVKEQCLRLSRLPYRFRTSSSYLSLVSWNEIFCFMYQDTVHHLQRFHLLSSKLHLLRSRQDVSTALLFDGPASWT
jgi:hypothetical protein